MTGRIQNPSKSHQNRLIEVATHLRLQKVLHVPKNVPLKMLLDVKSIKVLHSDCRSLCLGSQKKECLGYLGLCGPICKMAWLS